MKVGTKSILFGAHCFFIHPWVLAIAWQKLYGFPYDPRLWVAFFVHDLGYFGKSNMDGEEGERHPEFGARIMGRLFDGEPPNEKPQFSERFNWDIWQIIKGFKHPINKRRGFWYRFVYYHSRFLCKRDGRHYTPLCVADKLAIAIEPSWMYLPRAWLSGELHEYMKESQQKHQDVVMSASDVSTPKKWHKEVKAYCKRWAYEHRNGKIDSKTKARNHILPHAPLTV